MKKATITAAKNNLSALIDGLKSGSSVLIVDRGRPVARLEPVTGDLEGGQDGRLARLLREGLVRPRRARPPRALFSSQPPRDCLAQPLRSASDNSYAALQTSIHIASLDLNTKHTKIRRKASAPSFFVSSCPSCLRR